MDYTRRDFGKLALASLPAAALYDIPLVGAGLFQARPNSLINGVQIGTITYSYRSMPDQSAEATLKYIVDSGISAIELMGGPVESFAGAPTSGRGGGAGGGGRAAGGGRRGEAASDAPAPQFNSSWNGQPCNAAPRGDVPAQARGGGGGGRGQQTPEQQAAQREQAEKMKAWRTSV